LGNVLSLFTCGHWIEVDLANRPKNRVVIRYDGSIVVSESKLLWPGSYSFSVNEDGKQIEYNLELKHKLLYIERIGMKLTRNGEPVLVLYNSFFKPSQ
jgi:hypothetical protein